MQRRTHGDPLAGQKAMLNSTVSAYGASSESSATDAVVSEIESIDTDRHRFNSEKKTFVFFICVDLWRKRTDQE